MEDMLNWKHPFTVSSTSRPEDSQIKWGWTWWP